MLRETLRELCDAAERYVRKHLGAEDVHRLVRDIDVFRRAADLPREADVLHGLEKFICHCRNWTRGNERLDAQLEPFVAIALANRERIGGHGLLG